MANIKTPSKKPTMREHICTQCGRTAVKPILQGKPDLKGCPKSSTKMHRWIRKRDF